MTDNNPFLQAALEYADRGWRVFPCAPGTKMPHRGTGGVHEATTDPEKIVEWWAKDPKSNVAIRGGNGMVIVDADCKHGKNGVKALEAMGIPLDTLSASTPSGGRHYYFASMEKFVSTQGAIEGVDVRSEGTYVLAEPSVIDGRQYYFDDFEEAEVAPLPKELAECFKTFNMQETEESEYVKPDAIEEEEMDDVRNAYREYLEKEARPAVEGEGGHSRLLMAAIVGVHGFQLPKQEVKGMLWKYYNPRCEPEWNPDVRRESFEFERKVDEAQKLTPKNIRDRLGELRHNKVVESFEKDVHFQATNSGSGRYFMKKEDGEYIRLSESLLKRHLVRAGMSNEKEKWENESEIGNFILDTHLLRNLVFAGNLAGYDSGIHELPAGRVLSMRSPVVPEAKEGEYEHLLAILEGMFDEENRKRFLSWFYWSWKCLHERKWRPLPVVAMAGPAGCGKSLLIEVTRKMLGDTEVADCYHFMSGESRFNADLAGAHLLAVDDQSSSFDMRIRRAFGAKIKTMSVLQDHKIEQKGVDACNLRPHWRMIVACNDEPESIQVLPPIDDGMRDKMLLLKVNKPDLKLMPDHPSKRDEFEKRMHSQIPGLLHWISKQPWIEDYKDHRQLVSGWQDPSLIEHLHSLDDHRQLLELVDMIEPWGPLNDYWEGSSTELQAMLLEDTATRGTASKLLSWSKACGQKLQKLSKEEHGRVERAQPLRDRKWRIYKPNHCIDDDAGDLHTDHDIGYDF